MAGGREGEMPRKTVNVRVTITLPDEELKRVDHLAQQLTIPRSAVIRIAVLKYLKKRPTVCGQRSSYPLFNRALNSR
jgi:metal-responsive CopG/Arc/MetJ family transcriptional regulator